jgi:hypothetical protein
MLEKLTAVDEFVELDKGITRKGRLMSPKRGPRLVEATELQAIP